MIKRASKITLALFFAASVTRGDGQDIAPEDDSAEQINKRRVEFCIINNFEDKETQLVDFGFEGINQPGEGITIQPFGKTDYCDLSVIDDEIEQLNENE